MIHLRVTCWDADSRAPMTTALRIDLEQERAASERRWRRQGVALTPLALLMAPLQGRLFNWLFILHWTAVVARMVVRVAWLISQPIQRPAPSSCASRSKYCCHLNHQTTETTNQVAFQLFRRAEIAENSFGSDQLEGGRLDRLLASDRYI